MPDVIEICVPKTEFEGEDVKKFNPILSNEDGWRFWCIKDDSNIFGYNAEIISPTIFSIKNISKKEKTTTLYGDFISNKIKVLVHHPSPCFDGKYFLTLSKNKKFTDQILGYDVKVINIQKLKDTTYFELDFNISINLNHFADNFDIPDDAKMLIGHERHLV